LKRLGLKDLEDLEGKMISPETIDRIKAASDLVSVAKEYLPDLKRSNNDWKACCPFHHEKTASFSISTQKGIFKCFGCNAAGDVFKFVEMMDNITWIEAVRKLASRAAIEIKENAGDILRYSQKEKLFEILESAGNFYHRCLLESPKAQGARKYLAERGINQESIDKFKLGFAPKDALIKAAIKKGLTIQDLIKAGIVVNKGQDGRNCFEYMTGRLVFPIFDVQGHIVAFGGRTLSNQNPKYLNTPETIVYVKSANLYGLFQTLKDLNKEKRMIIVEGYVDVIVPYQFGVRGVVAPLGTAFTQNHIDLIKRHSDKVTLLFDSDDAGRKATQRALEMLAQKSIEATVSVLPEDIDADQYLNANGKESFLEMLKTTAKTSIDFMIDRVLQKSEIKTPDAKARAVSELLSFVLKNPNSIIQNEQVRTIFQKLNVDEVSVWKEFSKLTSITPKSFEIEFEKQNIGGSPKQIDLSLEQQCLRIALFDKSFLTKDLSDIFTEPFLIKIFEMALSGKDNDQIRNELGKEEGFKFDKLISDIAKYPDIKETFNTILDDLKKVKLKQQIEQLKSEVSLMLDGKTLRDENKLNQYKELTNKLKGSRQNTRR
jgi:DNA primase